MPKSSIPHKDELKLWRLAASRCSFPECDVELVKEEKDGILGEMAHIIARSEDWVRGQSILTHEERDSYDNLILLCPNHHTLIDNNEKDWPPDKLLAMKKDHEKWVEKQLQKGRAWQVHILPSVLYYINLRRLLLDPATSLDLISLGTLSDFDSSKALSNLGMIEFAQVKMIVEIFLKDWHPQVLSLNEINENTTGARVKFETRFRTKNVPGPNELGSFNLRGNFKYDPHIYCKVGNRKVYFSIDPCWITTSTAFGIFKSGQVELSGLGVINRITVNEAYITPLIIGAPDYPGSEFIVGRKFGEFHSPKTRDAVPREIFLDYD